MKTFKLYILLFCLIFFSCQKYVDIKPNSNATLIETAGDCQELLDNYDLFNVGYPADGEASADDYTIRQTLYPNLSNNERDIYTWQPYARLNDFGPWANCYNKIYNANLVIEAVEKGLEGSEDGDVVNNIKGSALFLRAYNFWNLAQLYCKPYNATTASQDPGIPLRTVSDISVVFDRTTVKQTYDRILADLNEAAGLLKPSSEQPNRPNKAAAYAMLARTYLSMGEYPLALTSAAAGLELRSTQYANQPLIDFKTALTVNTQNQFSPRFNKEVIFHSVMNAGNRLSPGSSVGNNYAMIANDLVTSYEDNDLRKQIYIKSIGDGTYRFFGNYEGTFNGDLFNGLAVDELYVVRAECYARAGNATAAFADLNTLLRNRYNSSFVDLSPAGMTADAVLARVLQERRKELVMRGQRWTDLRRLNIDSRFKKDQSRTVTLNAITTTYSLPANDVRYSLIIPQEVIQKSGIPQNQR